MAERQREAVAAEERARERFERERTRLREEVTSLMSEVRREGDELLKEIRSGAKIAARPRTISGAHRRKAGTGGADRTRGRPESDQAPLKVGDKVELGGIRGELVVMEPGKAVVSRGGLRIEVSPERLRRAKAESIAADARERRATPSVTVSSTASEREELNLIGMRTTEALRKLEEFLDQAYLTNRKEVRIIHGIGSGALRKAVLEYLATSPYSSTYHEAEPHHGGAGATVVELNL